MGSRRAQAQRDILNKVSNFRKNNANFIVVLPKLSDKHLKNLSTNNMDAFFQQRVFWEFVGLSSNI